MNKQQEQLVDLDGQCFVPDQIDRYVDYFFSDLRSDRFIGTNFQEETVLEEGLFLNASDLKTQKSTAVINQRSKKQTNRIQKNSYAQKIAKLAKQQIQHCVEEQSNDVHFNLQNMKYSKSTLDKKQLRLLKNKQAAQKSRKIKKQYYEKLADRVQQLQVQLDMQRKINEKNAQKLKKYSYNESILNDYFINRNQILQKLEEALRNKASQQQLNVILDSMRFQFSCTGKGRRNIIRHYYQQIVDIMVPDLCKFLIYFTDKNTDLFNHNNIQKSRQIFKFLEIKCQQQTFIHSLKQSLLQSRQQINKIAQQIMISNKKLTLEFQKIDNNFFQMKTFMNTEGKLKSILFLEKNRQKPQYRSAWKHWKNIFLQKIDCKQTNYQPKKLIKIM